MLENKYVYWVITTAIGLMVCAIGFFVKRTLDKNEKRMTAQEARTRDVEDKLNKTIADLPFLYTLREDFIRAQANHDRKLDQIITLLTRGGGNPDG